MLGVTPTMFRKEILKKKKKHVTYSRASCTAMELCIFANPSMKDKCGMVRPVCLQDMPWAQGRNQE